MAKKIESAAEKKQQLLKLARSGAEKPGKKERLGMALRRYCHDNGYDADFDNLIRGLRPEWFTPFAHITTTKDELLKLAESGAKRPNSNKFVKYQKQVIPIESVEAAMAVEDAYEEQYLGRALINYTNKSRKTYDAEFDTKIRALRPDWFN